MWARSVVLEFSVFLAIIVGLSFLWPREAAGAERPPDLYRSAPVVPWAKSVGEHRYRSPRNYDDTLLYYRKVLRGGWNVSWKKIINVSGTRAQHIENNKKNGRWEGLNIYEHKGATYIFVVFSDQELEKIAEQKEERAREKAGKKRKK